MTKPAKSATELAMRYKREAYIERECKPEPVLADIWERNAAAALAMPQAPELGAGGEVVQPAPLPDGVAREVRRNGFKRANIRNTLREGASRVAEDASVRRTDLLMQPSFDAVALAIDAAETIGAANSLEKMLAHQMAVAHEAAMRMVDRGLSYEHSKPGDQVEACRCLNTAARLMGAFQDGLLTLQRIRNGGNETVTVQQVNLAPGSHAVIGNVQAGGAEAPGEQAEKWVTPCAPRLDYLPRPAAALMPALRVSHVEGRR